MIEYVIGRLFKAGLWNKRYNLPISLVEEKWNEVLKLAEKESLSGIISDGIQMLDEEYQPKDDIINSFNQQVRSIEENNKSIVSKTEDIYQMLNQHGLRCVLMSGYPIFNGYLKPEHCVWTNIDLYICNGKLQEAVRVIQQLKPSHEELLTQEYRCVIDNVTVILRQKHVTHFSSSHSKRLRNWMEQKMNQTEQKEHGMLIADDETTVIIENHQLLMNFLKGNHSIRQMCDWCMMLYHVYQKIDDTKLEKELTHFGLIQSWKVFGYIAVNALGLPIEKCPLYDEKISNQAKIAFEVIMNSFLNDTPKDDPSSRYIIIERLVSILMKTRDISTVFSVFPAYTVRYWRKVV